MPKHDTAKASRVLEGAQARRHLQSGWHVYWRTRTYRLLEAEPSAPLLLPAVDITTGEVCELSYPDLVLTDSIGSGAGGKDSGADDPALFAPTLEAINSELGKRRNRSTVKNPLPTTSDKRFARLVARAASMLAVVHAVDEMVAETRRVALRDGENYSHTEAVNRACERLNHALGGPITKSTYYKYRKLCVAQNWDAKRMAAGLRRQSYNVATLDSAVAHFADTMLARYYGRNRSISISLVYDEFAKGHLNRTGGLWPSPDRCPAGQVPADLVEQLLQPKLPMQAVLDNPESRSMLAEISVPSRSWFYSYARWLTAQPDDGKALLVQRYGTEWWQRERMVFDHFAAIAQLPLQYVTADHYWMDGYIVDSETRSRVERLWLTVFVDAYSRSIVGFALLYEAPCIESVVQGLLHAIWPKSSHTALGVEGEWPCFGIPINLMLDNAWAHHSHTVENLSAQISQSGHYDDMSVEWRMPYMARRGALVERTIGTVGRLAKAVLPGSIHTTEHGAAASARERAVLLYEDVYRHVHQLVLKYQSTPHSALGGMTPNEKWSEGIRSRLPLVPALTPAVRRLFLRSINDTRQINQKGISVHGLHYWSADLAMAERIGRDGAPIEYDVCYDPADISRISLFRGGVWVADAWARELRQADGTTLSISMAEREIAQRLATKSGDRTANWLEYVEDTDETTKARAREKRRARAHVEAATSTAEYAAPAARRVTAEQDPGTSIPSAKDPAPSPSKRPARKRTDPVAEPDALDRARAERLRRFAAPRRTSWVANDNVAEQANELAG